MSTRVLAGVAAALAIAGCGTADAHPAAGPSARATAGSGLPEPSLTGTEWQLASYQDPGAAAPVPVTTDSTLRFDGKGNFSAHACNYIGGAVRIDARTLAFGSAGSTLMACTGPAGVLEEKVTAVIGDPAGWSVRARTLTITGESGLVLTYRVRPSPYPDLTARTIVAGDRAGGRFRLAVDGPAARPGLVFETQSAPGTGWGQAGMMSPGPKDCLAASVMAVGRLGGQDFVAAWATPAVATVTLRTTTTAPEQTLPFHRVPGSTLRIAGRWVPGFRPGASVVTFYDRAGAVLTAYPDGPC